MPCSKQKSSQHLSWWTSQRTCFFAKQKCSSKSCGCLECQLNFLIFLINISLCSLLRNASCLYFFRFVRLNSSPNKNDVHIRCVSSKYTISTTLFTLFKHQNNIQCSFEMHISTFSETYKYVLYCFIVYIYIICVQHICFKQKRPPPLVQSQWRVANLDAALVVFDRLFVVMNRK